MVVILCSENIECVAAPQYRILALARQGDCTVTSQTNGGFNLTIRSCHEKACNSNPSPNPKTFSWTCTRKNLKQVDRAVDLVYANLA